MDDSAAIALPEIDHNHENKRKWKSSIYFGKMIYSFQTVCNSNPSILEYIIHKILYSNHP